jgi:hypothetical protein
MDPSQPLPVAGLFAVVNGEELPARRVAGRSDVLAVDGEPVPVARVERLFYREALGSVAGVEVKLRGVDARRPDLVFVDYDGGDVEVGRALGLVQEQYNIWMGALDVTVLGRVWTTERDLPIVL